MLKDKFIEKRKIRSLSTDPVWMEVKFGIPQNISKALKRKSVEVDNLFLEHKKQLKEMSWFEKTLFTPSMCGWAHAPTSHGMCANTFS